MENNNTAAGFDLREAINEAKRCLNCPKPACKAGCPIENEIPSFISQLAKGNMGEALRIIHSKSNLPAVCGRVCPHELQCEGNCILNKKGNPIKIGKIERFIADFDYDMDLTKNPIKSKTRGKVAVIGSGPAGLTVAGDLAKEGFNATVFEAQAEPGGVLLYGIPAFRLPKDVVRREISRIESYGVNFVVNQKVGKEFTVDDIFCQGFDAVFIGSGTAAANELDIPGKQFSRIIQASYFLRMITIFESGQTERQEVPLRNGEKVHVIGGGNVAMDAARSALRYGASEVTVVYRGNREKMPALSSEYEEAVHEGVKFIWEANPVEYKGKDNMLTGLVIESQGEIREIETDKVFVAIGSKPASRIVSNTKGIEVNSKGYVITKEKPYGMTTRRGVFAGGDVVHMPATVVLAMKEAKKVASGIAEYIDAVKLLGVEFNKGDNC